MIDAADQAHRLMQQFRAFGWQVRRTLTGVEVDAPGGIYAVARKDFQQHAKHIAAWLDTEQAIYEASVRSARQVARQ